MTRPELLGEPPHDPALRALIEQLRDILVDQPGLRLLQSFSLLRELDGAAGEDRLDLVAVGHSGVTLLRVLFERGELIAGPEAWSFSGEGARPLVIAPPLGPLRAVAEVLKARLGRLGVEVPVSAAVLLARPLRFAPGVRAPEGLLIPAPDPVLEKRGLRPLGPALQALGGARIDAAALAALPARLEQAGLRPTSPLSRVAGLRLGALLAETKHWVEHEARDEAGAPLRVRVWTTLDSGGDAALRRARSEAADREALVLQALGRHAGVLQLQGKAEHAGQPALLFEAFEGGAPLRTALSGWAQLGAAPTAEQRLQLVVELAGVVEHCHNNDVLLGNLSPASLLLRRAPGSPARLELRLHHVESALAHLAGRAGTVGTRHAERFWGDEDWVYAAPERRRGAAPSVASDLFSLGAVAFFILTGRPPGAGYGPGQAGAERAVHEGEGLHPQAQDDGIDAEVDALVAKVTHPDPEQRPKGAKLWAAELLALQPGLGAAAEAADPARAERGDLLCDEGGRRLRVVEVLGYGSTARVLEVRALDGEGEDEPLALKVPRTLDRYAAIEAEAALLAAVQTGGACPHLVASRGLLRIGGAPCLLMDHAGALTLAAWVRRSGALPAADVATLGAGLYTAIDHLHERGLLHCDVKAENIGVDAKGELRLFDLSLACRSRDDVRAGTEAWRDPGLADRGAWDPAADLYAAALCLHFALSGELPQRDRAGFYRPRAEDYDLDGREALHLFFSRALSPELERRPPEAAAARREWRALFSPGAGTTSVGGPAAVSAQHLAVVLPGHPVGALGLSARAASALERLGVETAGELVPLIAGRPRPVGVGPQAYAELRAVCALLQRRFAGRADLPAPERFFEDELSDAPLTEVEPRLSPALLEVLAAAGIDSTLQLARADRHRVLQLVKRARAQDRKAGTEEQLLSLLQEQSGERDRTLRWVNTLISRSSPSTAPQWQRVFEHLLGVSPLPTPPGAAPLPEGGVPIQALVGPLQTDLASLRASLQKAREHVSKRAGAMAEVRAAVRQALAACAGEGPMIAPVPEVALGLLRQLGVAETPERRRRAVALVRLCAEEGPSAATLWVRRLGAAALVAEAPELLDAVATAGRRLFDAVFGRAAEGPEGRAEAAPEVEAGVLLSKAEAEALLRARAEGLSGLRAEALIHLAAAAAPIEGPRRAEAPPAPYPRVCVSPRGEPYAAGLVPARSLAVVCPKLSGRVSVPDLRSAVAQRLPEAAPLPDDPAALARLLEPLGWTWSSLDLAFVRHNFASSTATLGTRRAVPAADRAEQLAHDELRLRLRMAAEAGGFRALKVATRRFARAERRLLELHPELQVVSIDAALLQALDSEISAAEADPEVVLGIERQGPAGPHFGALTEAFLAPAWAAVCAGPLAAAAPLLLTEAGLLARWRMGEALRAFVREADASRARRWLLCPVSDEGAPAVIGHPHGDLPVPIYQGHQQIALSALLQRAPAGAVPPS